MPELNPYEAPQVDLHITNPPKSIPKPTRKRMGPALLTTLVFQMIALSATVITWLGSALAMRQSEINQHEMHSMLAAGIATLLTLLAIYQAGHRGMQKLVFFESLVLGFLAFYLLAVTIV